MRLQSYVEGRWQDGAGEGRPLVNPTTGEVLASADSSGLDLASAMAHAREAGGAALRAMSFAERGALLKSIADALAAQRARYEEIARLNSGNTKTDAAIDIDGGIGTLRYYARLGQSLGGARHILEAGQDQLVKEPVFFARHLWTSRPGVALQINAFNFPSWGLWEKVAVATLAGVPSVAKPATATALLSHAMVKDVIAAGVVPEGALSLVCGSGEGLLDALQAMDSVAFTGSAATGLQVHAHPAVQISRARVTIEADSLNATVLGPDAGAGTALFDLALREATKALSVKAGQLCTNIRRVFVPRDHVAAFVEALKAAAEKLKVGDPSDESVRVGPLVNKRQQAEAQDGVGRLAAEAQIVVGGAAPQGLDPRLAAGGAFFAPTILFCADPAAASAVHEVEVFGPCLTVMPYDGLSDLAPLAARGGGSLAMSLFANDPAFHAEAALALGPWHGRLMIVDESVGAKHTGHAIVMPQCVHGGPGRAGGGEELGGLRGLRLHMQRSAVQGSPATLAALAKDAAEAAL